MFKFAFVFEIQYVFVKLLHYLLFSKRRTYNDSEIITYFTKIQPNIFRYKQVKYIYFFMNCNNCLCVFYFAIIYGFLLTLKCLLQRVLHFYYS